MMKDWDEKTIENIEDKINQLNPIQLIVLRGRLKFLLGLVELRENEIKILQTDR